ncbi:MAG TPA: YceI family protein [Steroidobacteraceae bacterium]|nr:YceI family protein [Steroidobacteraceae bacterium]
MKRVALFFVVMLSGLLLTSCKTSPPGPISIPLATPPIISETPQYPQDLRGAQLYRIVSGKSWVHILVYRGGKLANLGHNHVISSQSINGYIWRHQQPALCGFDIAVPVDDLVVDNNDARAAEGAAFPLNVPDSARQGTMHNMLSAALLDSQRYPTIRLQSANVSQHDSALSVVVNIAIKDQIHLYSLPVTVAGDEHELHVHGEFTMKQTDFGIKPFSIAMGALLVQDELQIKFDLLADAVQ